MTDTLRDNLTRLRADLQPGDCITLCRSGNPKHCRCNCPGPGEDGSVCYDIEAGDPRSTDEIAREIESMVFPQQ